MPGSLGSECPERRQRLPGRIRQCFEREAVILSRSPQHWNGPGTTVEGGVLIGFRLSAMGELFIWQRLKGLSLGSESGKGGGGEGLSLKESQHLFHAVEKMEGRAKQLPPPCQSPRLRLILFHTVGNPHY